MVALGHLIERLIGQAKRAKVQVGTRSGVQPILSLESQLSAQRIRELVDLQTQKVMGNVLPDLAGRRALEVGEGPALFGSRMMHAQATCAVGVEIGGASRGHQGDLSRGFVVRAQVDRLPFPDASFDYLLGRLATPLQGEMRRALRELGRVVAPGGQGVVIDYHPYGLFAKRGSVRLRSAEAAVGRFEEYYRLARQGGLRVVDLREAFLDETTRGFFREEEIPAYRNLKGTPLLAFIVVYKPRGRG